MIQTLDLNGTWRLRWSDGPRHELRHASLETVDAGLTKGQVRCRVLVEGLGDNFFDVYPDIPYVIDWPFQRPPRIVGVGNLGGD